LVVNRFGVTSHRAQYTTDRLATHTGQAVCLPYPRSLSKVFRHLDDGRLRQLQVPEGGALPLGELTLARGAAQEPDVLGSVPAANEDIAASLDAHLGTVRV
jgi:hypothetical protein